MEIVRIVALVVNIAAYLYLAVLFARLVLDVVPIVNRDWRPRGGMLVVAEIVFTVTDPPLRLFRRLIPPLRIGPAAVDLAFSLVVLLCAIVIAVSGSLARL